MSYGLLISVPALGDMDPPMEQEQYLPMLTLTFKKMEKRESTMYRRMLLSITESKRKVVREATTGDGLLRK